jgi:hypothetical protein
MRYSLRSLIDFQILAVLCALLLGCGERQPSAASPKPQAPVQESNSSKGASPSKQTYDSPAKVHAAYVSAIERKEWGKAFDCLTSDRQDFAILGLCHVLAMNDSNLIERHVNEKMFLELTSHIDREDPIRGDMQTMSAVLKSLKDKRGFYLESAAELADQMREELPRGPLRKITVDGDHATGVVTREASGPLEFTPGEDPKETRKEYEEIIPFSAGASGWLIDAPAGSFPKVDGKKLPP